VAKSAEQRKRPPPAPSLGQLEQMVKEFADHCRQVIETADAMFVQNHLVMGQGRKGSNGQLGTSRDRDQE